MVKDAYGGAFSIWLFMFFFIIYVCFIAVALQFAKTYRVKNYVINVLEQYQYTGAQNDSALSKLDTYLDGVPYNMDSTLAQKKCSKSYGEKATIYKGVCIVPEGETDAPYYKVVVYFVAEFPLFNLNLTIPISGETKVIYVK